MDTSVLVPGYISNTFNQMNKKAFDKADEILKGSEILGRVAVFTIHVVGASLLPLYCSLRLIESVAFTAINLVGSVFNQGCRKNLAASVKPFPFYALTTIGAYTILTHTLFLKLYGVFLIGEAAYKSGIYDPAKVSALRQGMYNEQLELLAKQLLTTQATRKEKNRAVVDYVNSLVKEANFKINDANSKRGLLVPPLPPIIIEGINS